MKKYLTISLIPMIFMTSIFMIMESGEYATIEFYKGNAYKGYWSAALVEMFLTVFAAIYFVRRFWINFAVKGLMILLFLVMISGASLKIVGPMLDELSIANNNDRLISFLLSESAQSKNSLNMLGGQRTNTALQAKFHRELVSTTVKELQKSNKGSTGLLTDIRFTVFLRVSVQLANLIMAYILGELWRENFKSGNTKRKIVYRDEKTGQMASREE